ncbi:hypothetical protein MSG28_002019 [Choristoneura fumiferana]|uniref:Uncharacterized protein n=1 Tax=Choristoneura fumiferana TaxID=7141 RepID=A0ACC0JTY1_CHOFU|nr:hypothetical protein MSG28_002019 [Choristoneura fumiferana]
MNSSMMFKDDALVGSEVDSDVTVNDYLRNILNLRGTKYMCKEGGCGACIVAVTAPDPYTGGRRRMSVNSCLVSITSCQDWEITTIEGIGDRRTGYHPVQRTLAEYNGTQCGYCSVGWVMSMYSLLEANHYDLTQHQIENSFGSNLCRCTGYRPILDAFKSFAKDAPKPNKIIDIEDLKICKKSCNKPCKGKDWCVVDKKDTGTEKIKKIILKDNHVWYRVYEIHHIFEVLKKEGHDYMFVGGNTGRGAYPIFAFPRVLIDIAPVLELKTHFIDQNLVLGAATTLTDTIDLFYKLSKTNEEFRYLAKLAEHLELVAHIPVRNIMPRAQSAHAQVNAAFLYEFEQDKETVRSVRIVIGGISADFVHAWKTERYIAGKMVFKDEVLHGALNELKEDLSVAEQIAGEMKPEFKIKCALGLLYKGLLTIIPENRLNPRYRSGIQDFRRTRPLSKGSQEFDTNPLTWPITEPSPKVEALIQTSGEAFYVNDLPTQPREVFCAFVTSDVCTGEILEIDPSPALKIPGVLAFFSAKDIPGTNNFLPPSVPTYTTPEEIFCDGKIKYYDQAIGVIVAETEKLANRAALLVQIKYSKDTRKPVIFIEEAKQDPNRVSLFYVLPPRDRGANVQRVIKDSHKILWQHHFTYETLQTEARPSDDGLDAFCSTQWSDAVQVTIASTLNIEQNRINLEVPRCGGAYGLKISRPNHIAAVCALVSYLMNRPCRFNLGLQATFRVIGKRPPVTVDFEVGVDNRGEIQYLEYNLYQDQGYVLSDQLVNVTVSAIKNTYQNLRWSYKIYNVLTDTASNTWARSPGSLEAISFTELIMEEISYVLNRDSIEVRRANLNPQYPEVPEMLTQLVEEAEYNKRKRLVEEFNSKNRWKKRGLRTAIMSWPVVVIGGYQVFLTVLHSDGTVIVNHGGIELGQGVNTKVIQVVAYTLNISTSKVKVKGVNTETNANNITTGGSRTTGAVYFGAIKCCQLLLDRLSAIRDTMTDATWEQLIQAAYLSGINLQTTYYTTSNDYAPYRVGGVAMAECEVDILTGEHEILRVDIIEDCGTSVNPEIDIGQIEGSFIMGVGYWTSEHVIYDEKTGELLTDRTWYYHVPCAKDIPLDFRIKIRKNSYNPLVALGGKAVGEPATCLAICVAFAIREALAASREETGYPKTEWFRVDGPFTLEANVLSADVRLDEFKYK